MSEAPERIWLIETDKYNPYRVSCSTVPHSPDESTEYVRADRIEALEREVKELRADIETFWKPQFDEQVERAEAAEAERDEARISLGEAEHHLSNLLARIHRDGGHYEADHGAVKAAEDADKIVANLYAAEADKARLSDAITAFLPLGQVAFLWQTKGAQGDEVERYREAYHGLRAALSGSGSGWRGSYRLLETTDTIQTGDEVIGDDGMTWCPVDRWSIGCEVSRLFKSIRRPLPTAPQQGGE